MGTISVVTAVHDPVAEHLLAAYESLSSQVMPPGWRWEWMVQEDGRTGAAEDLLPPEDRVAFGTGRRSGAATTRNLALARARGELVKNLDQDDVLAPGVLARDIAALGIPEVQWTTSRALDLMPDGSTLAFGNDPPPGLLQPGSVLRHWRDNDHTLPVHPATLCLTRRLATALGGWMALPGSEDTGLVIAASVVSTGYFSADVGLLYRKWDGQETAKAAHTESAERGLRMSLISERADSLATLWGNQRLGDTGLSVGLGAVRDRRDHP